MADNITHGLAAALLAQAGFRQRYGSLATVALVVGSELPDLDAFFKLAGPLADFVHHRGITHSLLGGLGLAMLGAALLWGIRRSQPYWRVACLVYLGVLLHIWMDYLTSYGTQLLLPFDAGRYTSDTVFIIDYFYTGIMIAGLLLVRMVRQQLQRRYQAAGSVWLLLGAAFWLGARHVPEYLRPGLAASQAGVWLVLGASGALVALAGVQAWRPLWHPPVGTRSGLWLLGALGLWLAAPYVASGPLLLMARQTAGMHVLFFAAVVLSGAWLSRHWLPSRATVFGRLGVGVLGAYIAFCAVMHALAQQRMVQTLGPQMARVQRLSALPLPGGGAFHWRTIAETDTAYLVSRVSFFPPTVTPLQVISKGPDNAIIRAMSGYRLVQIFWDFARFPVIDYRELETETLVRYFDLRFSGDGRDRSWFDLTVHLGPDGTVRLMRFLNRIFPPPYHPDF